MTAHEWKVLASFGLLLGAIAMVDPKSATYVAGVAIAVIVVKNANKLPLIGDTASTPSAPTHPAAGGLIANDPKSFRVPPTMLHV